MVGGAAGVGAGVTGVGLAAVFVSLLEVTTGGVRDEVAIPPDIVVWAIELS